VRYNMRTQACSLFRFQQRGIRWLQRLRKHKKATGGIENLDVGFGKTVISLFHAKQFGWNVLYICPTNVVLHVQREILKHFGTGVSVLVADKWPLLSFLQKPTNVVIMSFYTVARLDPNYVLANNWRFKTCIVDEVQDAETKPKVKSAIAQLFQADFFLGLTAAEKVTLTPICQMLRCLSA